MTSLVVGFGSQWLSPQPLIKETSGSFMAKLCISRTVCACRGPVPGRHHPFASIGTSHLQNRQRNTQCETWDSWRWMAKPSALEKVISCLNIHLRSGCTFLLFRSLLVQPWAGPCTRCHPFLPAARDQDCLGATGLETSRGPMDQLHEGPSSSSQQPGAAAGKQSIPAELGWEL